MARERGILVEEAGCSRPSATGPGDLSREPLRLGTFNIVDWEGLVCTSGRSGVSVDMTRDTARWKPPLV